MITASSLAHPATYIYPVATLVLLAGGIVQALKVLLILRLLPQANPLQDTVTRVVAFLVSYALLLANIAVTTRITYPIAWGALSGAIVVFTATTGGWHLFTAVSGPATVRGAAPAPSTTNNTAAMNVETAQPQQGV